MLHVCASPTNGQTTSSPVSTSSEVHFPSNDQKHLTNVVTKLRRQSTMLVTLLQTCRGSAHGSSRYGSPQYSVGSNDGASDGSLDGFSDGLALGSLVVAAYQTQARKPKKWES